MFGPSSGNSAGRILPLPGNAARLPAMIHQETTTRPATWPRGLAHVWLARPCPSPFIHRLPDGLRSRHAQQADLYGARQDKSSSGNFDNLAVPRSSYRQFPISRSWPTP
ncbi:hypothetical protein SAMD00023353_9200330 [Rosellinia necatrix]|uniref:Uncharacterized protein n=1 Tax=Rosellinia necatrix TaxID=77044 RepID=A0A1S8AAX1_ROSNE|nr:hypothetical protein SAMD00023353_9200330 [Rosellinia necatrix]